MSPTRASRTAPDPSTTDGYWATSRRPLQILVFLLPLIIAYELCLALVLRAGDGAHVNTVAAHKRMLEFFAAFGIAPTGGLYLGGLVIVAVLLTWHVLARDRWRVDTVAVPLMAAEAVALALPLLVLSVVVTRTPPPAIAAAAPTSFASLDLPSQMAISVGAGLYEELIFRMVLIALIHTMLVDLGKMPHWVGATVAIVVSAVTFTWYHDLSGPDGRVAASKVVFYFLAGVYFGAVYTIRGFGIVVGVHAFYDVLTVLAGSDGG